MSRATGAAGTRTALEAAAVRAIAEEGWLGAGIRSVTRRAGVPLGAVGYHFGGKEALFRAAALQELGRVFATPGRVMAGARSLSELVEGMLGWSRADDVTEEQRLLLLEVMAQARRDPQLAAGLDAALAGYRAALASAVTRVAAAPVETAAVDAFAAHCDGLWLHSLIEPGFPREAAGATAAVVWVTALSGRVG